MPTLPPFDPHAVYVQLAESGAALPLSVDESFWTDGVHQLGADRLVAAFRYDRDWEHWEMHPEGEEFVIALSGSCDFVLLEGEREKRVLLSTGRALIVPRGVWHRAEVTAPAHLLHITAGEGTQHRPR